MADGRADDATEHGGAERRSGEERTGPEVQGGDAVLPDAEDAADVADLVPGDPPDGAAATGDPDAKAAVGAPVPAHGEMASHEQLARGEEAVEASGGGGTDLSDLPSGGADTGREGQGGSGQGTDDVAVGSPEVTARHAQRRRSEDR